MKTLAILQARASSTRLPNKVLAPILGQPMLARQIERLRRSNLIDRLVVATSEDAGDDALAQLCREASVAVYRGSLNDVLARFVGAYNACGPAQHIVRLTGDCPLIDPQVINRVIDLHLTSGADYTSNVLPPTFPDGLDVEAFRAELLQRANNEARLPSEREHVTPWIHQHPEGFKRENLRHEADLSYLRWTVDEPADLEFVRAVYAALYPVKPDFVMTDILALLEAHPQLAEINQGFVRNAGYLKSLKADRGDV